MKKTPASDMKHLLALLMIAISAGCSSVKEDIQQEVKVYPKVEEKTFFSDVDYTIQPQGDPNADAKKLIVERYLRLLARLDVFGLYCDRKNKMGYSTRVSALQRGSVQLEEWTEEVFGKIGAYNKFEHYRMEESLRYVKGERARTCHLGNERFLYFTAMPAEDFRFYLSDLPFGSI